MRKPVDETCCPDLIGKLLGARARFNELLETSICAGAVEFFDAEKFNTNSSVMENLIFGLLKSGGPDHREFAADPYVQKILGEAGILKNLTEIGHVATQQILDMFRDLPAGDERLSRFSVIDTDEMGAFESLLRRVPNMESAEITSDDRAMLLSVTMQLTPALHRLGLIDEPMMAKLVTARKSFLAGLNAQAPELAGRLEVCGPETITAGGAVRFNIMFGLLARHRAQFRDDVEKVMGQVIEELDLEEAIIELGLGASVGVVGARLANAQKQKLALARCLIKKPQILIVNEALAAIEPAEQDDLLAMIVDERPETCLIWIDRERDGLDCFDKIYVMRGGRIVEERGADGHAVTSEAPNAVPAVETTEGSYGNDMQVLDDVPMLSGLAPETLKLMAFTADRLSFADAEVLFDAGEKGEDTFVIIDGHADIIIGEAGHERVINTHGPGTLLGEIALLSDSPRIATVRANGDLKVLRLSRELFFDLIRQDANLGLAVMRSLSDRLVTATEQLQAAE